MKTNKKIILKILFILFSFSSISFGQLKDYQIYFKAKKLLMRREYEKAAETFKLLKSTYPDSRYNESAEFWTADMLEKKNDDDRAFKAYRRFIKKYPKSAWVDDAETRQIGIAERLIKSGNPDYKQFIIKKLDSPNKVTKYQAAVSLGKLRDQRALPVLKQMEKNGDKDMGSVAKSLIRNVEKEPIKINPRLRTKPDKIKGADDFQSKRRTVRQPDRRTSDKMPGYRKQSIGRKSASPRVSRPPSGSRKQSRTPAVKTKPSTSRSGSKGSSSRKEK